MQFMMLQSISVPSRKDPHIPGTVLFDSKSFDDEGPMILCNTGNYTLHNTPSHSRTLECSATPLRNLKSHMELLMSTDINRFITFNSGLDKS
jgi:hypothetical protein